MTYDWSIATIAGTTETDSDATAATVNGSVPEWYPEAAREPCH